MNTWEEDEENFIDLPDTTKFWKTSTLDYHSRPALPVIGILNLYKGRTMIDKNWTVGFSGLIPKEFLNSLSLDEKDIDVILTNNVNLIIVKCFMLYKHHKEMNETILQEIQNSTKADMIIIWIYHQEVYEKTEQIIKQKAITNILIINGRSRKDNSEYDEEDRINLDNYRDWLKNTSKRLKVDIEVIQKFMLIDYETIKTNYQKNKENPEYNNYVIKLLTSGKIKFW